MMDQFRQDIRYGFRSFYKNWAFTAVALLTIALSIGASSAVFSIVNAVLIRPLPFADPNRLVWVWGSWPRGSEASVSVPDFLDYRAQSQSFEQLAAVSSIPAPINLTGSGRPEQLRCVFTTANFFQMLGVNPYLGRTFLPEEDQTGHEQVAVLAYDFWQRRFGSDPNVVGQTLTLNQKPYTVVGIMPRSFRLPQGVQLWMPLPLNSPMLASRKMHFVRPIGRLKPGVGIEQAQAEMGTLAGRLAQQFPATNKDWSVRLVPLHEIIVGPVRLVLLVLFMAVLFVTLIACANIANLLLSRSVGRQKEMAMRAALGASRGRLIRQLFTEGVLLSLLGGGLGLLLALWGVRMSNGLDFTGFPRLEEIKLDYYVLGFTLLSSLLMGVVFSLAPAIWAKNIDLQSTLKEGGGTVTGGRNRLRSLLVVSEIALTVVLLIGAGLLIKSFSRLMSVDTGFDPQNILTMRIQLPQAKYHEEHLMADFYQRLLQRIKGLPGVKAVGAVSELPLSGQRNDAYFTVEGRPPDPNGLQTANIRVVTPEYFQAMDISLLKGNQFTERDSATSQRVVIINERMARDYFPDENPIGQHIVIDFGGKFPVEIVGVLKGLRHLALKFEPQAEMYVPFSQFPSQDMNIVARTTSDPMSLASAAREAVWEIDKDQPISDLTTMERVVSGSVAQQRVFVYLFDIFGGGALVLALIGIYGVISYSVSQRTNEIGIRMALGAQRSQIVGLVMRHGAILVLGGIGLGLAGALALTRVMSRMLFQVSATDPVVFVGAPLVLTLMALLASYVPARRATKVDPLTALRRE